MSYRRFGRGRGFGLFYGRGMGFGRGFVPNLSPYSRWFPGMTRGWRANSVYSNMLQTPMQGQLSSSQQSIPPYQYIKPAQQVSYQQASVQSMQTHFNCIYFMNGFCSLNNTPVDPSGPACQNFTPR